MGLVLSIKRQFVGKFDQHYIGLLYPITLRNFKKIPERADRKAAYFCPNFPLLQKEIFFENWLILCLTIGLHYAKIFLKISGAVNTSYIILVQIGPILLQKEIFFGNWLLLLTMYCAALCHKISKKFSKSESWNIRLDNFGQNQINYSYLEENFLGKLINITLV